VFFRCVNRDYKEGLIDKEANKIEKERTKTTQKGKGKKLKMIIKIANRWLYKIIISLFFYFH